MLVHFVCALPPPLLDPFLLFRTYVAFSFPTFSCSEDFLLPCLILFNLFFSCAASLSPSMPHGVSLCCSNAGGKNRNATIRQTVES